MDFFIDNSVINNMAIQFKAPQWVFKPFITLAILVGMYFAFNIIT